jgi:hypothetical protein
MNNRLIKITAGAAAVVAIALGGMAIGRTGSGDSAAANGVPGMRGGAQGGPPGGGFGTPVTGTAADKVKAAALAKYSDGKIERIMQRPDGSYEAHVFTGTGEIHVLVSKDFKVTGTEQGGGPPQGGGAPPTGTTPPADSQSS